MAPQAPNQEQSDRDSEHLKLLSIFHYVLGGIAALFACLPIFHLVIGVFFIIAPDTFGDGKNQPPAFIGWMFVVVASLFILLGWAFAVFVVIAGRFISQ